MTADPFTIRIFVPDGDPEGVRIIDRMNWTGLGIVFPRSKWADVRKRPELGRVGRNAAAVPPGGGRGHGGSALRPSALRTCRLAGHVVLVLLQHGIAIDPRPRPPWDAAGHGPLVPHTIYSAWCLA